MTEITKLKPSPFACYLCGNEIIDAVKVDANHIFFFLFFIWRGRKFQFIYLTNLGNLYEALSLFSFYTPGTKKHIYLKTWMFLVTLEISCKMFTVFSSLVMITPEDCDGGLMVPTAFFAIILNSYRSPGLESCYRVLTFTDVGKVASGPSGSLPCRFSML